MKRNPILIVIALVVLAVVWTAFGQRESSSGEQRRQEMRQRWESMSEEEREQFRTQMRERRATRRKGQLEAIKAIEEQLGRLEEGVEAIDSGERRSFGELSEEDRTRLRQQREKLREKRQEAIKAIIAQIAMLQGQTAPAEGEELVIVNTGELKAIHEMAVKEKATETAERIERISRGPRGFRGRPPELGQKPLMPQMQEEKVEEVKAVKKAPEFTLESFDGKTVSLSDYRGKIVVLEWFNFECPYVRYHYETVPTMVGLANKYKDKNVVWLAVNSTSHTTPEANKEFARKYKLQYLILDDRDGKVGRAYGAKTTPHMFIIDAEGNIAYAGAIDNSPMGRVKEVLVNYVDKALSELTSGKSVSVTESKPYGCSVKYAN